MLSEGGVFYSTEEKEAVVAKFKLWTYKVYHQGRFVGNEKVYCRNLMDFMLLVNHWNGKSEHWKYVGHNK